MSGNEAIRVKKAFTILYHGDGRSSMFVLIVADRSLFRRWKPTAASLELICWTLRVPLAKTRLARASTPRRGKAN